MFVELENSQGIYRSLVNKSRDVFCMDFNPDGSRYPVELINHAFTTELYYLKRLVNYGWAPELLDYDTTERKIYFRWYNNTAETNLPDNYAEQLRTMIIDLHREQIYKPAMYQKFFYTDKQSIMRGFTWYSSSNYADQPIDINFFKPILNPDRLALVNAISTDDKLDIGILMEKAYREYIKWPGDPLPMIYDEVYK